MYKLSTNKRKLERKLRKLKRKLQRYGFNTEKIKLGLSITIAIVILIIGSYIINRNIDSDSNIKTYNEYSGTLLNVDMDKTTNKLTYDIDRLTIGINDEYVSLNSNALNYIDINNIKTLDCYNNFLYTTFNEDAHIKELLITDNIIKELDTNNMKQINDKMYHLNNGENNKILKYIDNDSYIMASGKETDENKEVIRNIEDNIEYSKITEESDGEEVIIDFSELGQLKLSKISALSEAPGLYVNYENNILGLYNYIDNKTYITVSSINNKYFKCEDNSLIETNYKNLFITNEFNVANSYGYKTFALTTDNKIYIFRILEDKDNNILKDLLNMFDIDANSIEIKNIQNRIDIKDLK